MEQAERELAAFADPDEQWRGMLLFQAEKMLAARGYSKPTPADVELLASYIRRGYGLVNRAVIDHYRDHRFHHATDDPLFQREGDASHTRARVNVPAVADLIAKFKADPQRQKLSPKNALGFLMSFRLLEELSAVPVVILGGLYGGLFTPTEAAAAACGYALLYGFVTGR